MPSWFSPDYWNVVTKVWGYNEEQTNGGVIADNVTFDADGNLVLIANGDWYQGEKQGINSEYASLNGGKRTGGAIVSKQAYASGSFEAEIKLPSYSGICTAIWLYNNYSTDGGDKVNNEIDIELHGTNSKNINYSYATCTSWTTLDDYESQKISLGKWLNDGQFHKFRIDWHTGENARIEYYVDGVLIATQTNYVPENCMYFYIGCWLPDDWCGDPAFETDFAVVKSFSYTPFDGETATTNNCDGSKGTTYLENVALPENNLVANGSFIYTLNGTLGWVCDGVLSQQNGITFEGTLSQTLKFDCAEKSYTLTIQSSGSGSAVITYGSIVDGVEVEGKETVTLNEGQTTLTFTPPANCTQLVLEIIATSQLTVDEVNLKLTGS